MKLTRFETVENATTYVREKLTKQGMTPWEIRAYLAGATMLGVLQHSACAWWRDYLVNRHFGEYPGTADEILAHGEEHYQKNKSREQLKPAIDYSRPRTLLDP